jgi:hypothetical protein
MQGDGAVNALFVYGQILGIKDSDFKVQPFVGGSQD